MIKLLVSVSSMKSHWTGCGDPKQSDNSAGQSRGEGILILGTLALKKSLR
jgi:hypothetical protein